MDEYHSFMITSSPYPRHRSLNNSNKHSPEEKEKIYKTHSKTQCYEDNEYLEKVSKKYLYFHEEQKTHHIQNRKMSFPYNPLNLCYFENKFGSRKDSTQRKEHNFNSNRSIRKFLDSKLNTEPSEPKKVLIEKEVLKGTKLIELKSKVEESLLTKENKLQSISKESTKNSGNEEKCGKINKFPLVLKIKSKKAYFLTRFKNKKLMEQEIKEMNTVCMKCSMEETANPFEMKFRSKTEDNINLINALRQESKKGSTIKKNKQIFNTIKEDNVDPWEIHNNFMESSVKFGDDF